MTNLLYLYARDDISDKIFLRNLSLLPHVPFVLIVGIYPYEYVKSNTDGMYFALSIIYGANASPPPMVINWSGRKNIWVDCDK